MDIQDDKTSVFPRTNWSQLRQAAQADGQSLEHVIYTYWRPLKIFLIGSFPNLKGEAETILQDFAEDKILKLGWLNRADQDRGRFRDFLKTSLRNFVRDRLNRADAKAPKVPVDEVEAELTQPAKTDDEFDLAWVQTVLAEALDRMELDCKRPGKDQPRRSYIWEMFRVRLLDPILNDAPQPAYDELIQRFELKSPSEASNTLLSGKRIFKALLEETIKEYAGKDAATAIEVRALEEFLDRLKNRN